jgi:DNA-binding response OmpR family regulator
MKFAVLTKDVRLFEQVRECFREECFSCDVFYDEISLIRAIRREAYNLILLDADAEHQSGNPVFSWINCHSGHSTPVILLGHFRDHQSMTSAFEAGADDLVTRPVDIKELYARSLMVLRRAGKRQSSIERCDVGDYVLDKDSGSIDYLGVPVKLTSREFSMAWLFFSNPGVFFSRKQIATMIWGSGVEIVERTLEQHIYKLRKKLELGKTNSVQLRTVYSLGYKLEVSKQHRSAPANPAPATQSIVMPQETTTGPTFPEAIGFARIIPSH